MKNIHEKHWRKHMTNNPENENILSESNETEANYNEMLTDREISIILSVFLLVVFVVSLVVSLSHPNNLFATVMIFVSLLGFILVAMRDKE